jgi:hypothetical protein
MGDLGFDQLLADQPRLGAQPHRAYSRMNNDLLAATRYRIPAKHMLQRTRSLTTFCKISSCLRVRFNAVARLII